MPARWASIAILACLSCLIAGCSAGGFYGRYLVINSTGEAITALEISTPTAKVKWDRLEPGEGALREPLGAEMDVVVTWTTESGSTQVVKFSFAEAAGYRSSDDLQIELKPRNELAWRLVKERETTER
jgi:hypothetical protein